MRLFLSSRTKRTTRGVQPAVRRSWSTGCLSAVHPNRLMAKKSALLMFRTPRLTFAESTVSFSAPQSGTIGGVFSTRQISEAPLYLAVLINIGMSCRTTREHRTCSKSIKATQESLSSRSKPADLHRTPCECCQTSASHLDCGMTGKAPWTTAKTTRHGWRLLPVQADGRKPCYV